MVGRVALTAFAVGAAAAAAAAASVGHDRERVDEAGPSAAAAVHVKRVTNAQKLF